jgi:hypothetical protein
MSVFTKDPLAVLDYAEDWTAYLAVGETITSYAWSVAPTGELAISGSSIGAAVSVTGGVAGNIYLLSCKFVTSGGRTDTRSITIRVQNK